MFKRLIACALGFTLLGAGAAWADDIVVVVNAKAPVQSLSAQEVKDIYLGETIFWGSTKIAPVGYQDGTPLQGAFLDKVMKTSGNVYKTYWIKRIFREGGVPPTKASTPADALSSVSQKPGGITYVPASELGSVEGVREVFRVAN